MNIRKFHIVKKLKFEFIQFLLIIVIVSIFISIVLSIYSFSIFESSETQLLYLSSMKGQIVGSFFVLTLTAYIFFADKLREIGSNDADYYDATFKLRKKYFEELILIAILVGTCIFLCVVGISLSDKHSWLLSFVSNQSSLLFFVCIGSIIYFGIALLNPQKIDIEVRELGKKTENSYPVNSETESASIEQFLIAYNSLEKIIMLYSEDLYGSYLLENEKQSSRYKPQIIQALKILRRFEIIDTKTSDEINEIRMYRNSIVHSIENFKISKSVCARILELEEDITNKFNMFEKHE